VLTVRENVMIILFKFTLLRRKRDVFFMNLWKTISRFIC